MSNRAERRAALARVRATAHEWRPFEAVDITPAQMLAHESKRGFARSVARDAIAFYRNNRYAVQVYTRGEALHLVVRRHDGEEIRGWSDLQRIKNELAGPERVAIEVYPAASRLMDDANLRHLFVLPEGAPAPFDLWERWR